ncbi:hypothetical protein BHE74_00020266 [Ensete ventricosum]|nr:hypothetical protein BHE74_00020266 [Ensete ventricosum]
MRGHIGCRHLYETFVQNPLTDPEKEEPEVRSRVARLRFATQQIAKILGEHNNTPIASPHLSPHLYKARALSVASLATRPSQSDREKQHQQKKMKTKCRVLPGAMAAPGFQLALLSLVIFAVASSAAAAGACSSVTFSSNRVYAACSDLPRLSSSLHWSFDAAAATLSLAFVAPPPKPEGWIAWAINPTADGMIGSQALIAFHQPNGSMGVRTYNITGYGPIAEGAIEFQTSDLAAEYSGGSMRIFGKVKLPAGTTAVKQVWQVGSSVADGVPQQHATEQENLQSKGKLDLIKGAVSVSETSSSRNKNYRFYWNIYHHLVGYTVIILGIVNVFEGLDILGVDHKWRAGYIIAICILGGIALFLEVATWIVVLKRKSNGSTKPYGESSSNGVQKPLSV